MVPEQKNCALVGRIVSIEEVQKDIFFVQVRCKGANFLAVPKKNISLSPGDQVRILGEILNDFVIGANKIEVLK